MNWALLATHAWQEPLQWLAAHAHEKESALLHSSRQEAHTGRYSFGLLEPAFHATGARWEDLPPTADTGDLPDWVGYLGYGMREDCTRQQASPVTLPDFWLTRYQRLFRFDHETSMVEEFGRYHAQQPLLSNSAPQAEFTVKIVSLSSNMDRARYTQVIHDTVASIEAGDFYQANITRKFHGRFAQAPNAAQLFAQLCAASPAPYSAFIRHGDVAILSSSPESFLALRDGTITSRPIKGSIRRGTSESEDAALKKALAGSGKNLAENLMIVDLMRHDLAQVAQVGSVEVTEQSALYSYATIHHLVSTVSAAKRPEVKEYDVVRACFPPGSMTGAPKRAAMHWCETQEQAERGVYSGAIGWFARDRFDLSVVIRTLVMDGARFEFQVGGGIVAESDAEDEWRETLVKARGIATALGITEEALEAL